MPRMTTSLFSLLLVPAVACGVAHLILLRQTRLPLNLQHAIDPHHLQLVLAGSVVAAAVGLALLVALAIAGRAAQSDRALLLRLFRPGLYLTIAILIGLVVLHATLAVVAFTYAEIALLGTLHAVVVLAIGGGALFGVVTMIRACLLSGRRVRVDFLAVPLSRERAPRLWAFVDEIAATLGSLRPDHLIVGIEPNFFVTEADIRCNDKSLSGRTFYCSLPLCRILTKAELGSIIGHELGHYKGLDTQFSASFYPIYRGTLFGISTLDREAHGWSRIAVLPAIAVFEYFLKCFAVAEREVSRSRELAADQEGAAAGGCEPTATALVKLHAFAPTWRLIEEATVLVLQDGGVLRNLAEVYTDAVVQQGPLIPLEQLAAMQLSHPTDSHPPLAARLEALGTSLDATAPAALAGPPTEPAITLVDDADTIEAELSHLYQAALAQRLGLDVIKREDGDELGSSGAPPKGNHSSASRVSDQASSHSVDSVEAHLDRLESVEATLLRLLFGLGQPPLTLREAAATLGLSVTGAAGRVERALERLRWLSMPQSCHNDNDWDEA